MKESYPRWQCSRTTVLTYSLSMSESAKAVDISSMDLGKEEPRASGEEQHHVQRTRKAVYELNGEGCRRWPQPSTNALNHTMLKGRTRTGKVIGLPEDDGMRSEKGYRSVLLTQSSSK